MHRRDAIAAVISVVAVVATYGGTLAPIAVSWALDARPPAARDLAATFDPDGMEEGEGEDDAPPEALPGLPDVAADAPPDPAPPAPPTPQAPAPPAPPADADLVAVPDLDAIAEVDAPAAPTDVTTAEADPDAPADPTRPPRPAPEPRPPAGGAPGVDPTKVKDQGVKGGSTNTTEDCNTPHPQITPTLGRRDHWTIQKSLIEYYTSSIPVFNTLGWSRKYEGDDGVKGWQIGGFGCRGPLWKAGLRAKDVVQSVNGKKTNNVAQIISLWLFSKKKGDFEVVVWRKGQTLTLRYFVEVD